MLLMMGVCTRNMSSYEYINQITLLHQVGISDYFMRKMHGQTTLKFIQTCWLIISPVRNFISRQISKLKKKTRVT